MFDKHFVGLDVTGFENNGIQRPISRVTLMVDDSNFLTAGDDEGMELIANCPHATQAMVDGLLFRLKGYRYQMFSADDAGIDPAVELGDGVSVNGLYATISKTADDGMGYISVSAPGEEELEDEFPVSGPISQDFDRKIAETRSSITKTAEQIRLEVQNEVEGLSSSITVGLNSITSQVKGIDGRVSALTQTAESLSSRISDAEGSVSTLEQHVDSITLSVSNGQDTSTIKLMAGRTELASEEIYFRGMVTFEDLSTSGRTTINGGNIDTDTLRVDNLYGRYVNLNTNEDRVAGTISITGASTADYAVELASNGALRLTSGGGGYVYIESGSGTDVMIGGGRVRFNDSLDPVCLVPRRDGLGYLGTAQLRWNSVYAATGTIQTSDLAQKHGIIYDLTGYDGFFDRLRPMSFLFNNGESGRRHLGLGAQDVERAMEESGLSSMDFAGLIKSGRKDGGGWDYALRYAEFIPLLIEQVQGLKARMSDLEGSVNTWNT